MRPCSANWVETPLENKIQDVDSRIGRALNLLRVDEHSTAEMLADALWLAHALSRVTPPEPNDGHPTTEANGGPNNSQQRPSSLASVSADGEIKGSVSTSKVFSSQPPVPEAGDSIPATFINVPAADALPNRLAIERALKPFLRRFPSRRMKCLDGNKTAQASADRKRITPVFGPLPERWFDVLLLVEHTIAMEVWGDTVKELHALIGRHGAFRNVRIVKFSVKSGALKLFTPAGQPFPERAAVDPDGRRLCLFLTNGTSREWRRKPLIDFMRMLGRRTVVAIVQMLPRRLWGHTALGDSFERLHSLIPGAPNSALQLEDPFSGNSLRTADASYVPALTLAPDSVARWSQFVMSPRRVISPAILMEPEARETNRQDKHRTPLQRLAAFRSTASPESFRLLRVLAGAPLTLPVIRLVQQAVSAEEGRVAERFHLAEIMLSGLIERVTAADSDVPPDQVSYDFVPGVRELLLETLSSRESETVDSALETTHDRLRRLVEADTSAVVRDFRALLEDPHGLEKLPASARSFVEVSRRIYELRGIVQPGTGKPRPGKPIAIRPRVLVGEAPVRMASISGRGRYIASVHDGGRNRWIQVWHRETGNPAGNLVLEKAESGQLMPVADSDEIFSVVEGSLVSLAPGAQQLRRRRVPVPLGDKLCAVSPDGKRAGAAASDGFLFWDVDSGNLVSTYNPGTVSATALAMGPKTLVVGSHQAVFDIPLDKSTMSSNPPTPLCALASSAKALAVSNDESTVLVLTESGVALVVRSGLQTTLRTSDVTSISLTQDGVFAAFGTLDGLVSIWDLTRMVSIAELRHGTSQVDSVSLCASGDYAASASPDGLKSWDLYEFMQAARTQALRKARIPRRVVVHGDAASPSLSEKVVGAIRRAGHLVEAPNHPVSAVPADYVVEVGRRSSVTPVFPGALSIHDETELARLLGELDNDPPGTELAPLRRLGKKILVVGTAQLRLPSPVIYAARAIGEALATAGFDLVSGGCQGADYVVAEAYVHVVDSRRANVDERFTQIVEQGRSPDFRGGREVHVSGYAEWMKRVAETADAVVVVGGQDGSMNISHDFLQLQKPVIPMPGTEGAARELWRELHTVRAEHDDLWEAIDIPITTQNEADFGSAMAVAALGLLLGPGQEDSVAAREVLTGLRRFMKEGDAEPELWEAAWRWNTLLAKQALKAWLQIPPDEGRAESLLKTLPALFGSPAAVSAWFQNELGASPEEWQARLKMLQRLPIARRYLELKAPELYERDAAELRERIGDVASIDGIASCLKSSDAATRILGYIGIQRWSGPSANFDLAPCFGLERRDARRWRETRPLWQLLVCVDSLGLIPGNAAVTGELDETRTFLYANDDIDPGRECRNRLEIILFRAVEATSAVTQANVRLVSSCWRAPQHDAKQHAKVYRFDVVVEAPNEILDRIHRVEYQLPADWDAHGPKRAHQVIVSRRDRFKLKDMSYDSNVTVNAQIHVWGQAEPVRLSIIVKVAQTGPRL